MHGLKKKEVSQGIEYVCQNKDNNFTPADDEAHLLIIVLLILECL